MTLQEWIKSFESQFDKRELDATVVRGDIVLGMVENNGLVHYHKLKYTAKRNTHIKPLTEVLNPRKSMPTH